jgi:hypothetical protein
MIVVWQGAIGLFVMPMNPFSEIINVKSFSSCVGVSLLCYV